MNELHEKVEKEIAELAQASGRVSDPLFSAEALTPEPDLNENATPWIYGEAELECWRRLLLRKRKDAAKLNVGDPSPYYLPFSKASFQLELAENYTGSIEFRAVGDVTVNVDGHVIYRGKAADTFHGIEALAGKILRVDIDAQEELPALLIESGPFSTSSMSWRWSTDSIDSAPVTAFPQTRSGVPPHRLELREKTFTPVSEEKGLYDFGHELLGRITFRCDSTPSLFVGESEVEARNDDPSHFEQSPALQPDGEGGWISEHPLAFRYLRITGGRVSDVRCRALFHPVRYRGAFACSCERLNRIWMVSCYTLRLCMHDFLIDGIKRDRLSWSGDMAMMLLIDAYTFADSEVVRRSLTALGRPGISEKHINGIVDFSMWWIISQDLYQRYFGDVVHLRKDWPRIRDTVERLLARSDSSGLFPQEENTWLFIEWTDQPKMTALQILWWWALRSGAKLARRMGEETLSAQWDSCAETLAATLHERAWDPKAGGWRGLPDGTSALSRHPNLLAVISGLALSDQYEAIAAVLLDPKIKPVGTPFMAGFEAMALGQLGATDLLLDRARIYWGEMLDRGATTFWEAIDPAQTGDANYCFYDRPFGKSLCHAWAGGPAAFLASEICGLRPIADGWSQITVDPRLGSLEWARATVPTPHGNIEISIKKAVATLRIPAGITAQWGSRSLTGPGEFTS